MIFIGDIPSSQLADYIALSDIFVNLSARSSGVEQSLLEAMAQRKVIVGSEVSPLANVVEDGIDGFLIRPADTFTLAELLLQVPPEVTVHTSSPAVDLLYALYFYLT